VRRWLYPNPDESVQRLRRAASAGDAAAARALAGELLRRGQLSVQELAILGAPAREAILQADHQLLLAASSVLTPSVWVMAHSYTSSDALDGRLDSYTDQALYHAPQPAWAHAFREAVGVAESKKNQDQVMDLDELFWDVIEDWNQGQPMPAPPVLNEFFLTFNNTAWAEFDRIHVSEKRIRS
jgi:hypothetical protein